MAQAKHNKKKKFKFAQINPLRRKKIGQDESIRAYYDTDDLGLLGAAGAGPEESQDTISLLNIELDGSTGDATDTLPTTVESDANVTAVLPPTPEITLLSADDGAWSAVGGDIIKDPGAIDEGETPRPRRRKLLWIILGIVFGVLILGYLGASFYFTTHFGFNTVIDNIDCSFMTVDQVESQIADQVDNYVITIDERGGASETIKGSTVDLTYVSDGQIQSLMAEQQPLAWIARLFISHEAEKTSSSVTLNTNKLTAQINALKCMNTANMVAPQNAYAEYNGSLYVVHAEVPVPLLIRVSSMTPLRPPCLLLMIQLCLTRRAVMLSLR
jgi:hypothetical protein